MNKDKINIDDLKKYLQSASEIVISSADLDELIIEEEQKAPKDRNYDLIDLCIQLKFKMQGIEVPYTKLDTSSFPKEVLNTEEKTVPKFKKRKVARALVVLAACLGVLIGGALTTFAVGDFQLKDGCIVRRSDGSVVLDLSALFGKSNSADPSEVVTLSEVESVAAAAGIDPLYLPEYCKDKQNISGLNSFSTDFSTEVYFQIDFGDGQYFNYNITRYHDASMFSEFQLLGEYRSGKQIICDDKTFYMIQPDEVVSILFMDGTTVYKIQSTYDEAMTEQIIQTIQ